MPERRTQREPAAARASAASRLRREVADLRRELRRQRIVGPAVGVLAARLSCDLDQAIEELAHLAEAYGVSLTEAAASVLAATGPATAETRGAVASTVLDSARILAAAGGGAPAPAPPAPPGPPALPAGSAPPATPAARPDPADALNALARRLRDELAEPLGPVAVGLVAVAPDGSQQLVGAAGMPAAVARAWGRIPPHLNTASIETARTGRPRWLPRLDEARRQFVIVGEPAMRWPSRAAVPIRDGDRVIGVAMIFCDTPNEFARAARQAVIARVAETGPRFVELLREHAYRTDWVAEIQAILDLLPGAVALQLPIRDADGAIVDYQLAAASPGAVDIAGRRGRELVGLRALETYPALAGGELMQVFAQVLATGQAQEIGPFTFAAEQEGVAAEGLYTVRAHRHGVGLLISWVRHDEERRVAARLARTERLGNLGWIEWDFGTNTLYWSDQVYEIFGRNRAAGPMPPEELATRVLSEDLPALEAATSGVLENRRPMDVTYRFRVAGEIRHVRSLFQAEYDTKGRPVRAYGIVQDVSAVAAANRDRLRLADIERQLAERQRTLQTEHRLVTALQEIIMPLPSAPIDLPGLQVAIRYQPAEELARVGGDWYDLIALPCGRTLLAVGDVAGHGITAAATMARLRHALTALAVTTNDPAELLQYLNRMVCDDPDEPTATAVVARYDPAAATITWAQAGHPPPILITGGVAAAVERPGGMIVGARRDARYGTAELPLPADSRLLLYTDGLIERRGRFEPDWLGPLLGTLAGGDREPGDVLLGRLQPANPDDDTCMVLLRPLPG